MQVVREAAPSSVSRDSHSQIQAAEICRNQRNEERCQTLAVKEHSSQEKQLPMLQHVSYCISYAAWSLRRSPKVGESVSDRLNSEHAVCTMDSTIASLVMYKKSFTSAQMLSSNFF